MGEEIIRVDYSDYKSDEEKVKKYFHYYKNFDVLFNTMEKISSELSIPPLVLQPILYKLESEGYISNEMREQKGYVRCYNLVEKEE